MIWHNGCFLPFFIVCNGKTIVLLFLSKCVYLVNGFLLFMYAIKGVFRNFILLFYALFGCDGYVALYVFGCSTNAVCLQHGWCLPATQNQNISALYVMGLF